MAMVHHSGENNRQWTSLGRALSKITTGRHVCRHLVLHIQLSSDCVTWINLSFCGTQDEQEQEQHQGHSGNQDHFRRWSWIWSLQPTANARKQKEGREMSNADFTSTREHDLHRQAGTLARFISTFKASNPTRGSFNKEFSNSIILKTHSWN